MGKEKPTHRTLIQARSSPPLNSRRTVGENAFARRPWGATNRTPQATLPERWPIGRRLPRGG
eukprot:7037531-Alexandrium_andersonii.AAC.1